MTADGAAPPRAGRPDAHGVDLFAAPAGSPDPVGAGAPGPVRPGPPHPVPAEAVPTDPVPTDPVPTDPVPKDPVPAPRSGQPAGRRYTVEHRVPPAHRAPLPTGGARPAAAVLIAVGLGLAGLVIAANGSGPVTAFPAAAPVPAPPTGVPSITTVAAPADLRATEVALPTVGVRSRLVDLDVGPDGALQAPPDPAVPGWYVRGSAPGEPGPAVIAGHVDSRAGPAVFYRLDELAPGDRVEVTRSDGRVFAYRVATVEQHPKDAFPTARVYGPTPGPELRLVTCGGDFDRRSRHYRDNVVVTAIPA